MKLYITNNGDFYFISVDNDPNDDWTQMREQAMAEVLMAIGFWEDK